MDSLCTIDLHGRGIIDISPLFLTACLISNRTFRMRLQVEHQILSLVNYAALCKCRVDRVEKQYNQ